MIKIFNNKNLKTKVAEIDASELLSCVLHEEINGLYSLTFSIPLNSIYKSYLDDENNTEYLFQVKNEFYYFINKNIDTDTQQIEIVCRHVITLLDKLIYIPIYPIQVNQSAADVLTYILNNFQNEENIFKYKTFTNEELAERGLSWCPARFDIINGFDYTTAYEMISNIISLAGRGELYFENFKFAVVEKIGKDSGEVWDKEKNIKTLNIQKNYDELMNVILIEGKDGMPLNIKEFPNSVISDSESIQKYGVRRGHISYNDINDKDELKRRAMWEIDALNPDRVSVPKITINCEAYDVKNVKLGDTVKICSKYDEINEEKRVISCEYNLLENAESRFILGDKALSELQLLAKLEATRQTVQNITDTNGDVDTSLINTIVAAIEGRNRCRNSCFALFDGLGIPEYWQCQNGFINGFDSRFGSYSLQLVDNGIAISDFIDAKTYEESASSLIQVWHKGNFDIVVVATDETGNYDIENPTLIPFVSKFSSGKVARVNFSSKNWSQTAAAVVIDNEDLTDTKCFKIILQATSENCLIGGVYAGPGNLAQLKLYTDGPYSSKIDTIGKSDVFFNNNKNAEEKELATGMEEPVGEIQMTASTDAQLNLELLAILETIDEKIDCNLRLYDNEELKYDFPMKALGGGKNTLSCSRVLDRIAAGAHILVFKILNNGVNNLKILKNSAVLSLKGKFVEMAEVPPIPVIDVFDYIKFSELDITGNMNNFKNQVGLFDMSDEVRFEFNI